MVYIDECGIDNNEIPPYAYGPRGQRIPGEKKGHATERVSIISALNQGILQASLVFTGYCDRDVFEAYVEEILITTLVPGLTIILDNASFHKGGKIELLINDRGCEVMYLPAYSPDLNPIERSWFPLKHKIRSLMTTHKYDVFTAAEKAFDS